MKDFMGNDFLLNNEVAKELYEIAEKMPIVDFHCHLNPKEIVENKRYKNITEMWLAHDHYKWRAMRSNGIDEKYITGESEDFEKFLMWAKTVENAIGNPLYHWTHLELKRFFGIEEILSEETAEEIWNKCNEKISSGEMDVRNLIEKAKVQYIATTDDPIDNLEYHIQLKKENLNFVVAPTFRADNLIKIKKDGFVEYIENLEKLVDFKVNSIENLNKAIEERVRFFKENGCSISDHGIERVLFEEGSEGEVNEIFIKALEGKEISEKEEAKYFSYVMNKLGELYCKYDFAMQLHIGPLRNNNKRMFNKLGPDSGFDSINDHLVAEPLSYLLNSLDEKALLPKTILYCLNPKDNEVIATMLGNFQSGVGISKIQFGSGWWFNDQKDGMERQMMALSQLGLISKFIGMLTDSRSFLSYTRHEYFRRILCNFIGEIVYKGEYPKNDKKLQEIIENICYYNSKKYFKI
ncbi:MAG: glucuronate isomerase [Sarcina sp.]